MITYKELLEKLKTLSEEELACSAVLALVDKDYPKDGYIYLYPVSFIDRGCWKRDTDPEPYQGVFIFTSLGSEVLKLKVQDSFTRTASLEPL